MTIPSMPRFSANLTTMFTEVPFLERFERAASAGFDAVEFQFPYDHPADEIRRRLDVAGQTAVLFNAPAGDAARGERGLACLPDRADDFRAGVRLAADYAERLGVARVHCMAGIAPPACDGDELRATFVANLRFAAAELGRVGAQVLVEPLNRLDMPGYYLADAAQAIALVEEAGSAGVRLQYDLYHAHRSGDDLAASLSRHLGRIGHLQIADSPGRHEPGSGEIDFAFLLAHIDRIGYRGHVGCEYTPSGRTEDGLGWMHALAPSGEGRA